MIEVTTSFKCAPRTYSLAVALLDSYLRLNASRGRVIDNAEVHGIGVACMFVASKYEDIYPLHSRVVSDKISHGAFTQRQILKREQEFMRLFQFQFDLILPYDIH